MDFRKFSVGTIVGAVVLYVVGYLIFHVILGGFYDSNSGLVEAAVRPAELQWAVVIAVIAYSALIGYAMQPRAVSGAVDGAKIGAVVGFLLWVTADFVIHGWQATTTLTLTLVDPLVEAVRGGIAGAAIAMTWGWLKRPAG
jgi:uncharacterized membrane protein